MLLRRLSKHIAAISFAIAIIAVFAISGGSTANAQDGFYRGRDFEREHQRRELRRQNRHEEREKDALRSHQQEERYEYGDSRELRNHQHNEWEDLRDHRRDERHDLEHHQDHEQNDRYNDGYLRDGRFGREDGYYDDRGVFRPYRRTSDGYYDQFGRFHRFGR